MTSATPILGSDEAPPAESTRRGRRSASRWTRGSIHLPTLVVLVVTIAVGIALRLNFAAAGAASLDADEAVTGVMARRILEGHLFIYFTSQSYNGAFEQYLQALIYAVLHLPQNPFTLRLAQVILATGSMVAIYFLGRIAFVSRWTPVLATAIFAVGPFWNIVLGTKSYGAYDTAQLASLIAIIAGLRVTGYGPGKTVDSPTRRWVLWWGLLGFCIGFVIWNGLSGLEVLLVVIYWVLPTFVRSLRSVIATVVGGVIGVAPVILWMSRNGWQLPGAGPAQPVTTLAQRFDILFHQVGREYLGMGLSANTNSWGPTPTHLLFLGIAIAVVVAVILRWRGLLAVLTLRSAHRTPIDLVLWTIPCALVIYLVSTHTWWTGNPRYLFVLYPMTSIAVAAALGWLAGRRWLVLRVAVIVLTLAGLVFTLQQDLHDTRITTAPNGRTSDAEFQQADAYLESQGIHAAYAEYFAAVPADYWADPSKLSVAAWDGTGNKSGAARPIVDATPTFAYLTANRSSIDETTVLINALKAHGVTYDTHTVGTITLFTNLSKPIRPGQLGF